MLSSVKTLTGYRLLATDGEVGKVADFYFDDKHWTIRYLVANTGGWLSGRLVLISPHSLGAISTLEQDIAVGLTKGQIEASPSIDMDKPVSRQYEETYFKYYGWPIYWGVASMGGNYPYVMPTAELAVEPSPQVSDSYSHLQSAKTLEGYAVQALDGFIGHISDFIIDQETWAIRYLVIDARKWWHGKHFLLAPEWEKRVSWDESNIFVSVTLETIKLSPEFDPSLPITADLEDSLKQYYESYSANNLPVQE